MRTIAAISTSPGIGGIGIIRVSGQEAFSVVSSIFRPKNASFNVNNPVSGVIKYGVIFDNNKIIDEVLVAFFKSPHSYTTENTAEINCHGGVIVMRKILNLLFEHGAFPAEPGEFTKRAFLNGRIDLTQAEAVIDIINSKTEKAENAAVWQLKGGLKDKLIEINKGFYDVLIQLEAMIDYPEYDVEEITKEKITKEINYGKNELERIYKSFETGRILKNGLKTLILGKPNVGKSSLMNILLREERSIVTDIPGTTRDMIEESLNIAGIPILITDTAGIRDAKDKVEEIGVKKAVDAIKEADMIIAIFDISRDFTEEDNEILKMIENKKSIIVINKTDLNGKWEIQNKIKDKPFFEISIKDKSGIENIEKEIERIWNEEVFDTGEEAIISNIRHKNLIWEALKEIDLTIEALKSDLPVDMISINITTITGKIGEIVGQNVTEEVINGIFKRFCLGK